MLTKVLIFVAVLVGVFVVARMGAASALPKRIRRGDAAKAPERKAQDLRPCPVCGAWSAGGEGCPCGGAPTP